MLGGGMRQAGIIAAGGLYALRNLYNRLADDHAMAKQMAEGLAAIGIDVIPPESNIVIWKFEPLKCTRFVELCAKHGLKIIVFSEGLIRAVPHYGNTSDDVQRAITIIAAVMKEL